jgi:hypothetical protein
LRHAVLKAFSATVEGFCRYKTTIIHGELTRFGYLGGIFEQQNFKFATGLVDGIGRGASAGVCTGMGAESGCGYE